MPKSRSKNQPPRVLSETEFSRLAARVNVKGRSSDFMRAALHEMRTPLQIIQGLAELMDAGNPLDRLPDQVDAIRRETARLTAVFDDLRYRRDLEDNCLSLQLVSVNVLLLVEELAATLEKCYPAQLVTQYPRQLPRALADPIHLRMILWTLLHNAARLSGRRRRGVIELTIQSRGHNLDFMLADNSARISPKHHTQIFEPFTSLPRRPRFGLGQGLYVARELARAMQGDLCLKTPTPEEPLETVSRGNVFVLTLPLAGDDR